MTNTTTDAAEARALPQPSAKATALAMTATPADFPTDSYGLALWLDRAFATAEAASGAGEREDVKAMVGRFLAWPLPADFAPDNGISATRPNYGEGVEWRPIGTNLLTAAQAEAMIRYLLGEVAA